MSDTKNPGGKPLMYKTVEGLQAAIDEYFTFCDNRLKQIYTKEGGEPIGISNPEPYTMSGLAYALGMDRRTLLDYSKRDEYLPTIKRARARIEQDVERRLNDKDTFTPGLIFNAKNNFGWNDKSQVESSGGIEIITRKASSVQKALAERNEGEDADTEEDN
jgi:hypothetical protein